MSRYAQAGVNIDAGAEAVRLMSAAIKATYGPEVLTGVGAFGGQYSASGLKRMDQPVLVASTDGVGTKTRVAARLGRWDSIGHDIVNHCVNDILVQGARPLFFLDYVASAHLDPEQIATIVGGIARACQAVGCALLGGETAEMPGVYQLGEVDLVGTIVGVVERGDLLDGAAIRPGDALIGLPSSGLHTNGYSLARAVLDDLDWVAPMAGLDGKTLGDVLLAPHRCYLEQVGQLRAAGVALHGLAHITGGGLSDNLPRILPPGTGALIRRGSWHEPAIFGLIARLGGVDSAEMFRVFNMGVGMVAVIPAEQVKLAVRALTGGAALIGEIIAGEQVVTIAAV